MKHKRLLKFTIGAIVLLFLGYSLHRCSQCKEGKLTKSRKVDHAVIPAESPKLTVPPLHVRQQAAQPNDAKVFRWNGSSWEKQVGFCSGNYSFRKVRLHPPEGGSIPIYVHENSEDKYVSAMLASSGTWDHQNVLLALNRLKAHPGSMFLDVGAQLGSFSLSVAKTGRRVVAVDPLLENVLRLCKSLQDGGLTHLVTVLYVAVSDSRGAVSFRREPGNLGGTQVIKVTRPPDPNDPNVVETVLLDDVIPFITTDEVVVKIDVEKHEYEALSGGREFLRTFSSPDMLMEWLHYRTEGDEAKPILKLMADHNYTALHPEKISEVLDPANYTAWPPDVLWTRRGKSRKRKK